MSLLHNSCWALIVMVLEADQDFVMKLTAIGRATIELTHASPLLESVDCISQERLFLSI
jgi:hypothetical protein